MIVKYNYGTWTIMEQESDSVALLDLIEAKIKELKALAILFEELKK
jgi:hypothetical protein